MDNQVLTWAFMVIAALVLDIAAYIFLRLDWKKNGIALTDRFLNRVFEKVDSFFESLKTRAAIALLKYHKAVAGETPASAPSTEVKPEPAPAASSLESVPVLVSNVGKVRRIKFFVDMPLDTQVDVRIGATREAGVTVEKREL